MKQKILIIATLLSITLFCSFNSFARPSELINTDYEKEEITVLEDVILDRLNNGGARAEIKRDVTKDDIDFDRAYRVYGNSLLFKEKTDDTYEIKEILKSGNYIWQIPIFIGNDTVFVDIYKNTEISGDVPDDIKEELEKTMGEWQVGAIYVYNNRIVDFGNTVRESLMAAGLNADDYAYEFVSGLPGIRYPVAVVFDETSAMFIVPAELESARAFEDGSEAMEYIATSSNASPLSITGGSGNAQNSFPVYHFQDVAQASRNASKTGLGGGIGISHQGLGNYGILVAAAIIVLGAGGFSIKIFSKNSKGKN